MKNFSAFVAGLIFGIGLIIAGMANPAKVLAFLDPAGKWDPSLALVMAGGIALSASGFFFVRHRQTALLGGAMQIPTTRTIDKRLVIGSAIFGVGWGIAGICPGPALLLLGIGSAKGATFVAAMLIGMGVFSALQPREPAKASV